MGKLGQWKVWANGGAWAKYYHEWSYESCHLSIHGYIYHDVSGWQCDMLIMNSYMMENHIKIHDIRNSPSHPILYLAAKRVFFVWIDSPLHNEILNQWPNLESGIFGPGTCATRIRIIRHHIPIVSHVPEEETVEDLKTEHIPSSFASLDDSSWVPCPGNCWVEACQKKRSQSVATWTLQNWSTFATSAGSMFQE